MTEALEPVADEEVLYRSVRASEITLENGQIVWLSSQAFADRSLEISFNRARFRSAEETRLHPEDAVVSVLAREVRAIVDVIH